MKYVGPRPLIGFVTVMLLCVTLFAVAILGVYIVDEYVSPSWNANSVPAPMVD